ncbi:uncharacterized protein LOC119322519 isoform X1 [Triticum dicoccoides]|uniref:uncharacterized protein LOC119322519 isoform X1 n=1 Tax=Triticum dicoccoides TaxID=85692 RepID=UPI00188FFA10|nr:uncharacterized protein LOC119322519 isoform X1 [Triticum dicoccoides]
MPRTLPAGKPPARATQPPEPATPSPKSRMADAQLPERKRKVAPSAGPPKKKNKKTRSPPAEPEKKPLPLPLPFEHARTPGDEAPVRATQPPDPAKSKHPPSAKSREADAQLPERKRKTAPSADPPQKKDETTSTPAAEPGKKPLPSEHAWTPGDEVKILEALAAHRQENGKLPRTKVLFSSLQLQGRFDNKGFSLPDLRQKVRSLKGRHDHEAINGVPAKENECSLCHLSKTIWGTIATSGGEASAKVPNAGKTFDEMCQLYPCLTDEVTHIVDEPAVLERLLLDFDDTKARALDSKIDNLRKEVTEAIMESAKRQNLEVPKVWQCPCTKLQPAKSRTHNESILLVERLDKIEGAGVEMQEQLKRIKLEMAELKKSSKVIRCDSAASAPHSVVAEKQFSGNVLQRKIEAQGKVPHCKNREVTSKYRPPRNLVRNTTLVPKSMPRVRREKIDAESQILHDVEQRKVVACAQQGFSHDLNVEGGKEVFLLSYLWPHRRVAKATLQTSCTSTIVGDKALGPGCCLVLVNQVLDGKAPLIRPLRDINTMNDALGHSIAWTRQQIQDDTTAAIVAPNQASLGKRDE